MSVYGAADNSCFNKQHNDDERNIETVEIDGVRTTKMKTLQWHENQRRDEAEQDGRYQYDLNERKVDLATEPNDDV